MKLLIADDERDIADAIGIIMKYSGYDSDIVYDGEQAYQKAGTNYYDVMIFDVMMPKLNGFELIKRLRSEQIVTPILMLTAKAEVEDRIEGLTNGADDYLAKPFDKGELIARINGLLRRNTVYSSRQVQIDSTHLNMETLELVNQDHSLRLSGKETEILGFFMTNYQKWLPVDTILEKIWSPEDRSADTLKLYINYLNNKLKSVNSDLTIDTDSSNTRIRKKD